MARVAVQPSPASASSNNGTPRSATPTVGPHATDQLYEVALVAPLPAIDVTKTLAGSLLGRGDDAAFNARIVAVCQRLEWPVFHIAGLTGWASLALFIVADHVWRHALSIFVGVTGCVGFVFAVATLSTDMLRLVMTKFEFWFTGGTIAVNITMWGLLFHDVRVVMTTVTGINYLASLVFDSCIYTRRFAARSMMFGSPGLLLGVALTAFHVPPDLHYVTFHVLGLRVEALDVLVTGNLVITYFTASRVLRCRHIVFSKEPLRRIQCDMYFPTCRLVPRHSTPHSPAHSLQPKVSEGRELINRRQRLQLVRCDDCAVGIDATHVALPRLARLVRRHVARAVNLNALGLAGLAVCLGCCSWTAAASSPPPSVVLTVCNVGSLAASLLVAVAYAAHYQRSLARQVLGELDTWFVLVQLTLVTVGMCDAVRWRQQPIALAATAWIWCLWLLLLDAVPPVARTALRYDRRLTLVVHVLLVACPAAPVYWLYFAPARAALLQNRVLFAHDFGGGVVIRIESLGFLASKLFTLWVWMGRLLWRELRRPSDAFKLIKRRVQYQVPT